MEQSFADVSLPPSAPFFSTSAPSLSPPSSCRPGPSSRAFFFSSSNPYKTESNSSMSIISPESPLGLFDGLFDFSECSCSTSTSLRSVSTEISLASLGSDSLSRMTSKARLRTIPRRRSAFCFIKRAARPASLAAHDVSAISRMARTVLTLTRNLAAAIRCDKPSIKMAAATALNTSGWSRYNTSPV